MVRDWRLPDSGMHTNICPNCGRPVKQTAREATPLLHPCMRNQFANDQKPRKYGGRAWNARRHMLTDVDTDAMSATCSQCGQNTRIYSCGGGARRFQCANHIKAQKRRLHNRRSTRESGRRRRGVKDMTDARRDWLIVAEVGLCAVCGEQLRDSLHVDHRHLTGESISERHASVLKERLRFVLSCSRSGVGEQR
jgi:hypothetical protein